MNLFSSLNHAPVHDYHVPLFLYLAMLAVLAFYAVIEFRHSKHDHVIKFKEALKWSLIYIFISLAFSVLIFFLIGKQAAGEYLAAWGIEKALSLDNLFIMGLIFTGFKVKPEYQRRMLNYGIAGAIIFRLIFILAGFELLRRFEWVSIIFGLILLRASWKAYKEARGGHDIEEEFETIEGPMIRLMNKVLPIYPKFVGHKLTTKIDGKRMLTMMAAVIIIIAFTDIIFAVDSVPAVLAVSPDRFIAYSSNVFALLGLRALFFVYEAVADKFWAINWALSAILGWISFKMITGPFGLEIPIIINLGVLFVLFFGSMIISIIWQPKHKKAKA